MYLGIIFVLFHMFIFLVLYFGLIGHIFHCLHQVEGHIQRRISEYLVDMTCIGYFWFLLITINPASNKLWSISWSVSSLSERVPWVGLYIHWIIAWKNSFRGVTVLLDRMLCLAVLYTIIYWQEQINNNLFILSSHLSLWHMIFSLFLFSDKTFR